MSTWIIRDRYGVIRGTGPTEGQAWMAALKLSGHCFSGWVFLEGVEFLKGSGDEAVEWKLK